MVVPSEVMAVDAKHWIEALQLRRHPEGGSFRETYRSPVTIARPHLPPGFSGDRSVATAIYFLLEGDDFSALHRIKSDEMWHFYDGTRLVVSVIDPDGGLSEIRLGRDVGAGEAPQAVVRAGCLFGSRLHDPRSYALVG